VERNFEHVNSHFKFSISIIQSYTKAETTSYFFPVICLILNLTNSVVLVRKRTIPTEWPPLVDEVSADFSR
jgi:hypothetical protein